MANPGNIDASYKFTTESICILKVMESELANCIVVYILRHKLLSRRLCLSQARMKEEGSAVGLQPTQVKHIEQQKQRKILKEWRNYVARNAELHRMA